MTTQTNGTFQGQQSIQKDVTQPTLLLYSKLGEIFFFSRRNSTTFLFIFFDQTLVIGIKISPLSLHMPEISSKNINFYRNYSKSAQVSFVSPCIVQTFCRSVAMYVNKSVNLFGFE